MGKDTLPEPHSSTEWLEHFRANEEPEILPEGKPGLTEAEKAAVVASVQEFQLGESSRAGTCTGAPESMRSKPGTGTICGPWSTSSARSSATLDTCGTF